MKTYQDLLEVGENDQDRMEFVRALIKDHQATNLFRTAQIAEK